MEKLAECSFTNLVVVGLSPVAITCIFCFKILILTYSDFTFDNVNFDLRKRSAFKYILQLLNICFVFK